MIKQRIIAMSLLGSIAVIAGCSQSDMEKQIQPEKQGENAQQSQQENGGNVQKPGKDGEIEKTPAQIIQEKFDENQKEIDELTNEVHYFRTFVKDFTSTFSTEEMQDFVEKEWDYKIKINDIAFPKNGILELGASTFDLVVTEDKVPYSVIPDEMSESGRIPNGLASAVSVSEEIKAESKEDLKDKHSTVTYSFKNIPNKTVIKLTITEELQKELELETKDLEIHIQ